MEFYSFSFGEMKVAQADKAAPALMAMDITFGFKAPDTKTVQTLELRVSVPHDPDRTIAQTQQAAYERAGEILRAAAEQCATRGHEDLAAASESQLVRTDGALKP